MDMRGYSFKPAPPPMNPNRQNNLRTMPLPPPESPNQAQKSNKLPLIYYYDFDNPTNEKKWLNQKEDITDYFNYGMNERTWRIYAKKVRELYDSGARNFEKIQNEECFQLNSNLPIELGGFGKPYFKEIEDIGLFKIMKNNKNRFYLQHLAQPESLGMQLANSVYREELVEKDHETILRNYKKINPYVFSSKPKPKTTIPSFFPPPPSKKAPFGDKMVPAPPPKPHPSQQMAKRIALPTNRQPTNPMAIALNRQKAGFPLWGKSKAQNGNVKLGKTNTKLNFVSDLRLPAGAGVVASTVKSVKKVEALGNNSKVVEKKEMVTVVQSEVIAPVSEPVTVVEEMEKEEKIEEEVEKEVEKKDEEDGENGKDVSDGGEKVEQIEESKSVATERESRERKRSESRISDRSDKDRKERKDRKAKSKKSRVKRSKEKEKKRRSKDRPRRREKSSEESRKESNKDSERNFSPEKAAKDEYLTKRKKEKRISTKLKEKEKRSSKENRDSRRDRRSQGDKKRKREESRETKRMIEEEEGESDLDRREKKDKRRKRRREKSKKEKSRKDRKSKDRKSRDHKRKKRDASRTSQRSKSYKEEQRKTEEDHKLGGGKKLIRSNLKNKITKKDTRDIRQRIQVKKNVAVTPDNQVGARQRSIEAKKQPSWGPRFINNYIKKKGN